MPTIKDAGVEIHYEEFGSGYPILLIAPGGMSSAISFWERATINPITAYVDEFRLIAMDQRNSGASIGRLPASRPWDAYRDDQLLVANALELETFFVFGCCIGGPYALKLAHDAPQRVRAVVVEQPLGLVVENHESWMARCHTWADQLVSTRTDLNITDAACFIDEMWHNDFVASLTRDEVAEIEVPLCVLPGIDDIHPNAIGHEIAELVAGSIVIEPWKDTSDHTRRASDAVRNFLHQHKPNEL